MSTHFELPTHSHQQEASSAKQHDQAMAIVFLDTEFTDLLDPELLSIGLVTLTRQEGLAEFYVELDLGTAIGQARREASSDFVRDGVFEL